VVDGDRLAGLVSLEDFIKWLADRQQDCAVEKNMTVKVETLYEDEPLVAAIGKFERTGLGRFPVLSRQPNRLVGIVTKGDIIEGLLKKFEIDYHHEEIERYRPENVFEGIEADQSLLVCQYDVPGQDIQRAGGCSSRLKKTLVRLGMPPDLVRRVAIASYEAEMNVVVFTDGGKLRAKVEPSQVLLEVEDSGPGIADLEKALQPGYSTAPEWVRELGFGAGMGLTNIQKNSDRFDIQSEVGTGTFLKVAFFANGAIDATG
jgi:CBS domain-containing protein